MTRRVLLIASDRVGSSMAGPGIRYTALARVLAEHAEVTLVAPFPVDTEIEGVRVIHIPTRNHRQLLRVALDHDDVITQRLPLGTALRLARSSIRVIADLYAPTLIENAVALVRGEPGKGFERTAQANAAALRVALATADAFICGNERQRDFVLGALATSGRIDAAAYETDATLRNLVAVVPFGTPPDPPTVGAPVVKGVVPGIDPGDALIVWPGGVWDWTDAVTAIRAIDALSQRQPNVRLYFPGLRSPNESPTPPAAVARARSLAHELGLVGTTVFFEEGWTPTTTHGAVLAEADVAICAAFDDVETHFAFRSRLIDCIWARLPIATTSGDSLSDVVAEHGLGRVVAPGDHLALAAAVEELLDERTAEDTRRNLAAVAPSLLWERSAEPLLALLNSPPSASARPVRAALAALEYVWFRAAKRVASKRAAGL